MTTLISQYLEGLDDDQLSSLLEKGSPLHSGIGGTSVKIEIHGKWIFVKKLPINEVEGKIENILSTKNLFDLPSYYQYGVGSAGFNVWREVSALQMSNSWIHKDECKNFPLFYHFRILKNSQENEPLNEEEFKKYVEYWDNSSTIGERFQANQNARTYVALFIEYIPETLDKWLKKQLMKGKNTFDEAIEMVERNLRETTAFIQSKGMLHFDAHFQNILTDGDRLFFSDFGLVMSSAFDLSEEESLFFKNHQHYDHCFVVSKLTKWIILHLFGKERFEEVLNEYAQNKTPHSIPETLTPYLTSILKRYAPITLEMNIFTNTLTHITKRAIYPADRLEQLLNDLA